MTKFCKLPAITSMLCLLSSAAYAENDISDLFALNMKELANLKVTSVSKREENASQASAAIHVLTSEDIRRSGALSLPEVLRLVPGVQVSRTDSSRWRVSIRGFNEAFTNKLLVLIDGRSIYTPLFSGVYWDTQNPPLEDIERIEVIRGSAGSTFGANAVNGVINVITKKAAHTQGTMVSGTSGDHIDRRGYTRYGGKIDNQQGYYRIYAQNFGRDELENTNDQNLSDDWQMSQSGFRVDYEPSNTNELTVQGEMYYGVKSGHFDLPNLADRSSTRHFRDEDLTGGHILTKWNHFHDDGSESILQTYMDFTRRNHITLEQSIYTYDLDYQYNMKKTDTHEISLGLGYRFIYDYLDGTIYNYYDKNSDENGIISAFIQDKIVLIPDTLSVTLGSKFEHNDYTGFEVQPTARFAWTPDENQTIWGAVSRSVRTPSRAEQDISLVVGNTTGGFVTWQGNPDLKSEELISFEIGYKATPSANVSVDLTAFANNYDNLRTTERRSAFTDTSFPGVSYTNIPLYFENRGSGEIFGGEIMGGWNVNKNWTLSANYTLLKMNMHVDEGSTDTGLEKDEEQSAENLFSVSSKMELPHNIEFDNYLYYVDNLTDLSIESYLRYDTRLSWRPKQGMELSLVGQNLFNDEHSETSAPQFGEQSQIGSTVYGQINYQF